MKQLNFYIIGLLLCSVLLSGCYSGGDEPQPSSVPMSLNAVLDTRADDNEAVDAASDASPAFLFYRTSELVAESYQLSDLTPYCVRLPGSIDSYKESPYDTGINYPENNNSVMATGYAPYNVFTPMATVLNPTDEQPASADYSTLTLTSSDVVLPGKVDVLVAQELEEGSSLRPFTQTKSLTFGHAQSKLLFKARRDNGVQKFFKNVVVTIGGKYLLKELKWGKTADETPYCYKASAAFNDEVRCEIGPGETESQLQAGAGSERTIGELYIYPGLQQITFSLRATMANNVKDFDDVTKTKEVTSSAVEVTFVDAQQPITLQAGDSYEVILVFQEDKIELVGRKMPWEDGGNIIIPVYPLPDNVTNP